MDLKALTIHAAVIRCAVTLIALGCLALAGGAHGAGGSLPPIKAVRGEEFPRSFTKGVTDFGDWAQLEPLYARLEAEIKTIKDPGELDAWLLRRSELASAVSEEGERRNIAYSRQTDDPKVEAANLHFIEKIVPRLSEYGNRLDRLYLACPARFKDGRPRLEVYDRNLENQVKLFRKENIPLQTEETKLGQAYQKLSGAMTVKWQGTEKTQEQMAGVLEQTDRAAREQSWRLVWTRRLQDHDKLNEIYDKQFALRLQIARNAGFENYRDYAHQANNRFDYTPQDCLTFDEAVAREVVPVLVKMRQERQKQMGLETMRPWDIKTGGSWEREVDALGRPPLEPFKNGKELEAASAEIIKRLSPTLAGEFETMRRLGLLDLESRKGKAPGGYCSGLAEVRLPFLFMNAAGTNRDVITMLHECGHCFHVFATRQQPILFLRDAPTEFCEVASMSMELFGASQLDAFYKNPTDVRRARYDHLTKIIQMLCWIANIDAFQQWVYTHPGHSAAEREDKWRELEEKYSPGVDWTGLEGERRAMWQRQLHLYQFPFYYIEYGIDQLAALQLWMQFRENQGQALENYQKALALGGSKKLPELFEAAGIKFDFSQQMIHTVMQAVGEEMERLSRADETPGDKPQATRNGPAIQAVRGQEFPRVFTKGITDPGDWTQLEPFFDKLEAEIKTIETPEALMAWLKRCGELNSVIGEEGSRRSIAYTCQTGDAQAEKANLEFIEKISPKLSERGDRLSRLYLACPARLKADRRLLEVLDRNRENSVKLFRQENIALETKEAKLAKEYQKINGAMTVKWRGQDKTLQQMAPVLEETDRAAREEAWKLIEARRQQDCARLNTLYDELIALRQQIAQNAGFKNFRDYAHQDKNRFDYTPQDCLNFDEAIAREVVPVYKRLLAERREQMKLDTLRPWDLAADPLGRAPLRPFQTGAELEAGCARIFSSLNATLGGEFETLRRLGLLDLESRKGKAPGGYQASLSEVRLPFIFMNAAGTHKDLVTLLHEGGHAFHTFACRGQELAPYRHGPTEFNEVASMSMEMFGDSRMEEIYKDPTEARRARRDHLIAIVKLLPWIATIDAFQQWVYTHPGHSVAEREEQWLALEAKYAPGVDWTGFEKEHRAMWQRQLHLFQYPFYYIEYGIDQVAALQLWMQFRENPARALENYQKALALGGSRPLPELFKAAGIKFDFSQQMIHTVMQAVGEELERLK